MTWTPWIQVYDPLGSPWLSTAAAAFPIVLLLVALALFEWRAYLAALAGLVSALAVSVLVYGMPLPTATATALYGAAYGFLPIGWIILNAVFLYNLTVHTGQFEIVKSSVGRLSKDRRVQALLVAFSFGAFIEGAAGFGTPVAICSALLIGLGFTPLYAAGLSLIANTAPVAFGAIGTPILTLAAVTGYRHRRLAPWPAASFVRVAHRARVDRRDDERLERTPGVVAGVLVVAGRSPSCSMPGAISSAPSSWTLRVDLVSIAALALLRALEATRRWSFLNIGIRDTGSGAALGSSGRRSPILRRRARVVRAGLPWLFLSLAVILWGSHGQGVLNGGPSGLATYLAGERPYVSRVLSPWNVSWLHRAVSAIIRVGRRRSIAHASRIGVIAPSGRAAALHAQTGPRPPAPPSCLRRSRRRCSCESP